MAGESKNLTFCVPLPWVFTHIAADEDLIACQKVYDRITRQPTWCPWPRTPWKARVRHPHCQCSASPSRQSRRLRHVLGARPDLPLAHTLTAPETLGIALLVASTGPQRLVTPTADSSHLISKSGHHVARSVPERCGLTRAGINMRTPSCSWQKPCRTCSAPTTGNSVLRCRKPVVFTTWWSDSHGRRGPRQRRATSNVAFLVRRQGCAPAEAP